MSSTVERLVYFLQIGIVGGVNFIYQLLLFNLT